MPRYEFVLDNSSTITIGLEADDVNGAKSMWGNGLGSVDSDETYAEHVICVKEDGRDVSDKFPDVVRDLSKAPVANAPLCKGMVTAVKLSTGHIPQANLSILNRPRSGVDPLLWEPTVHGWLIANPPGDEPFPDLVGYGYTQEFEDLLRRIQRWAHQWIWFDVFSAWHYAFPFYEWKP